MNKIRTALITGGFIAGVCMAFAQDVNVAGSVDYFRRANRPFFTQNTLVNVTNTSVETTVASMVIPANSMGSNGFLRITMVGDADANNANNKFFIFRFGGTVFRQLNLSGSKSTSNIAIIWNRNNPGSQVGFSATVATPYGVAITMPATGSINTTVDQTLLVTISNNVSSDSMNLQALDVSIIKRDPAD